MADYTEHGSNLIELYILRQTIAGYLIIALFGVVPAVFFGMQANLEIAREAESYRAHALDEAGQVEASIRSKMDLVYQSLRTISLLPNVRRVTRHGETLDADSHTTLHQLYAYAAHQLAVSEIYIVPADLDPTAIDPATGKPEEPILMLDEAVSGFSSQNPDTQDQGSENLEYMQLRQHIDFLKKFYPILPNPKSRILPLVSGASVITRDHTLFKLTRRAADRSGLILSVPFYSEDGALKGTISAIVLDSVIRQMLPARGYALINLATGYLAVSNDSGISPASLRFVSNGETDPSLFFSTIIPVALQEGQQNWKLWSGQTSTQFVASTHITQIAQSHRLVELALFCLVVSAMLSWKMWCGRKEMQMAQWYELSAATIEGLVLARNDSILAANESFKNLIGSDNALPNYLSEVFRDKSAADQLRYGVNKPIETSVTTLSGERIPVEISVRTSKNNGSCQRVLAIRDLRERKEAEQRMHFLALHDPLTKLVNLTTFQERLQAAFQHIATGEQIALLSIDLDHFKYVNDTFGHPIGDKLLQNVAKIMKASIRDSDTVARVGGDEFVIIQIGARQPYGAMLLADRIVEALSQQLEVDGHIIQIGASVGIAIGPDDGVEPIALIACADLALYSAKSYGRSTFRFYDPELSRKMRSRRSLEGDVRAALADGQFELHYQPIVNAVSERFTGFEALLRWRHPIRGLISPADLIPVAEELGLMGKIGAWVLQTGCAEAMKWPNDIWVAINVSPTQFKGRSLDLDVEAALERSGLPGTRLRLEITEGILLHNTDSTLETLNRIRNRGVRIAMDDFGTGYSSLNYLTSFSFDAIKIDRSFISQGQESLHSQAVVRAVIGLGAALGMSTTAEGVETQDQLERLQLEGCTELQGFLFSKPVPAIEISQLLERKHSISRREAA